MNHITKHDLQLNLGLRGCGRLVGGVILRILRRLCAFKGGEWIRVAGELVEDDRVEARE